MWSQGSSSPLWWVLQLPQAMRAEGRDRSPQEQQCHILPWSLIGLLLKATGQRSNILEEPHTQATPPSVPLTQKLIPGAARQQSRSCRACCHL